MTAISTRVAELTDLLAFLPVDDALRPVSPARPGPGMTRDDFAARDAARSAPPSASPGFAAWLLASSA